MHTVKNITSSKLEQTSGISENTLKYHSNKKSKTVDLAKPMVKATASKGKLSAQEQKMIKAVYFDCAEPSARMLRASLAEDESHLHGKLSQVKFDNTSVC